MKIFFIKHVVEEGVKNPFPVVHLSGDIQECIYQLRIDPPISGNIVSDMSPSIFLNTEPSKTLFIRGKREEVPGYRGRESWVIRGEYIDGIFRIFDLAPNVSELLPFSSISREIFSYNIPFCDINSDSCFITVSASDLYISQPEFDVEIVTDIKNPNIIRAREFFSFRVTQETELTMDNAAFFKIELVNKEGLLIEQALDIFVASTAGFIPKRKLSLERGMARFSVMPLGLFAGDVLDIAISVTGHKNIYNFATQVR